MRCIGIDETSDQTKCLNMTLLALCPPHAHLPLNETRSCEIKLITDVRYRNFNCNGIIKVIQTKQLDSEESVPLSPQFPQTDARSLLPEAAVCLRTSVDSDNRERKSR